MQTSSLPQERASPTRGISAEEIRRVLSLQSVQLTQEAKGKLQIHAFTGSPSIKAVVEDAYLKLFSVNAPLTYREQAASANENSPTARRRVLDCCHPGAAEARRGLAARVSGKPVSRTMSLTAKNALH